MTLLRLIDDNDAERLRRCLEQGMDVNQRMDVTVLLPQNSLIQTGIHGRPSLSYVNTSVHPFEPVLLPSIQLFLMAMGALSAVLLQGRPRAYHQTLLHYAIFSEKPDCIRVLLESRADPLTTDSVSAAE